MEKGSGIPRLPGLVEMWRKEYNNLLWADFILPEKRTHFARLHRVLSRCEDRYLRKVFGEEAPAKLRAAQENLPTIKPSHTIRSVNVSTPQHILNFRAIREKLMEYYM